MSEHPELDDVHAFGKHRNCFCSGPSQVFKPPHKLSILLERPVPTIRMLSESAEASPLT